LAFFPAGTAWKSLAYYPAADPFSRQLVDDGAPVDLGFG
jgi:hypothetical protein